MVSAVAAPTSPLVVLDQVCVELGGRPILRGVTAALQRQQITALIGLNGAGKTTLLKALLGEVTYQGRIRFDCVHGNHQQPGHIGYVPQRLRLEGNLPLTVLDLFGLSLSRAPWFAVWQPSLSRRVEQMLGGVGVPHLLHKEVRVLSGGELQRVLLALALEPTPELLLLDEPAAGIDFQMQEEFYQLIGRFCRERGVTILMVSHDLSMVHQVAQHVWCLKDGRIECEGSPQELLHGEALARTFGAQQGFFLHQHG
ncbi:MAG: metal ABC transporter ATP-binding protein [Gemmataceae bacterium]